MSRKTSINDLRHNPAHHCQEEEEEEEKKFLQSSSNHQRPTKHVVGIRRDFY